MGYLHIDNLYKNGDILMFKECYAMEKIHGTSAHVHFARHRQVVIGNYSFDEHGNIVPNQITEDEWQKKWPDHVSVSFFAGGEKHENFIKLFDKDNLLKVARDIFPWIDTEVFIYGEAYGGKCQGMSGTYGKELKFVVFDVKVGSAWLSVPQAEEVAKALNLEFVWYTKTTTDIESLDKVRTQKSEQAKRNGCGDDKMQEGVVLRSLVELRKNDGHRIIVKYKNDEFKETKTPRVVGDSLKVLEEAMEVADEWVTEMRLSHVLDKIDDLELRCTMKGVPHVMEAMLEDITREGQGELNLSHDVKRAISRKTVSMFKARISVIPSVIQKGE